MKATNVMPLTNSQKEINRITFRRLQSRFEKLAKQWELRSGASADELRQAGAAAQKYNDGSYVPFDIRADLIIQCGSVTLMNQVANALSRYGAVLASYWADVKYIAEQAPKQVERLTAQRAALQAALVLYHKGDNDSAVIALASARNHGLPR